MVPADWALPSTVCACHGAAPHTKRGFWRSAGAVTRYSIFKVRGCPVSAHRTQKTDYLPSTWLIVDSPLITTIDRHPLRPLPVGRYRFGIGSDGCPILSKNGQITPPTKPNEDNNSEYGTYKVVWILDASILCTIIPHSLPHNRTLHLETSLPLKNGNSYCVVHARPTSAIWNNCTFRAYIFDSFWLPVWALPDVVFHPIQLRPERNLP